MSPSDIVIVDNADDYGDWEGMYVAGELVEQEHRLRIAVVLEALNGITVGETEQRTVCQSYLDTVGDLPSSLSDIPEEAFV